MAKTSEPKAQTEEAPQTAEAEVVEAEAAPAGKCSHEWKWIQEPKGFHNQRCTRCKGERRARTLNA